METFRGLIRNPRARIGLAGTLAALATDGQVERERRGGNGDAGARRIEHAAAACGATGATGASVAADTVLAVGAGDVARTFAISAGTALTAVASQDRKSVV